MKKSKKILSFFILMNIISYQTFSQDDQSGEFEAYGKANIAFTNFKLLGVSNTEFAKCVESINYLDPSKTLRFAKINGVVFADDGNNYDLVANDGILTSMVLFKYTLDTPIVDIGVYRLIKNNTTIYDVDFKHKVLADSQGRFGISITCKFVYVPCSAWPPPIQKLCRQLSWPFIGSYEVTECSVTIEDK